MVPRKHMVQTKKFTSKPMWPSDVEEEYLVSSNMTGIILLNSTLVV